MTALAYYDPAADDVAPTPREILMADLRHVFRLTCVSEWVGRGCPYLTVRDAMDVTMLEALDPESILARDARRKGEKWLALP